MTRSQPLLDRARGRALILALAMTLGCSAQPPLAPSPATASSPAAPPAVSPPISPERNESAGAAPLVLSDAPATPVDPTAPAPAPGPPATTSAPQAGPPSALHRTLEEIATDLDQGRAEPAQRRLAPLLAGIDRDGPLDEQMAAHALMGRIQERRKAIRQAAAEYARVRELWKDPSAAAQRIGVQGESDGTRYVRLARALNGVGEAVFFAAEQARIQAVDPLRFPAYRRPGTRRPAKALGDMTVEERDRELARRKAESDAVREHIDGPVRAWVTSKQRAVQDTEREYTKVLDLQPVPPPRWVVAAASRVGAMWGDFADEFGKAPVPSWVRDDPELMSAYQQMLESAAAPLVTRARAAFQTCRGLADKYRIQDERAVECTRWLDAHP